MDSTLQLTDSLDRARGPMLAAAIGDALGWPVENRSGRVGGIVTVQPRLELAPWVRREGGGYAPHEVKVEAGSYSDDTQLTLAIARSRLRGEAWWDHFTGFELPLWLLYERGAGGASKRAARAWNKGQPPWSEAAKPSDRDRYFDAGGNGVAMRILPHAIVSEGRPFDQIASDVFADGITTHGHPRALVGALAHTYAICLALSHSGPLAFGELVERTLDGEDQWGSLPRRDRRLQGWDEQMRIARPQFEATWERTREEMRSLLLLCRKSLGQGSLAVDRPTLEAIGAFDKKVNGAGTIAAAAAIFLASRHASQPGQGLVAAAFAKGADTDTIAAMAGALIGAIDRDAVLSSLKTTLQDAKYIEAVAASLAQDGFKAKSVGPDWRQPNRRAILESLWEGKRQIDLPVFGSCGVEWERQLPTKSSNAIREWLLRSEEGQTLHVKRVVSTKGTGPSETPSRRPTAKQPLWLVLRVRDIAASESFYSDKLGLDSKKDGSLKMAYVADRIALEETHGTTSPSAAAHDEGALLNSHQAITLFRDEPEFSQIHARLLAAESPVSHTFTRGRHQVFRCTDPDGTVIEVRSSAPAATSD